MEPCRDLANCNLHASITCELRNRQKWELHGEGRVEPCHALGSLCLLRKAALSPAFRHKACIDCEAGKSVKFNVTTPSLPPCLPTPTPHFHPSDPPHRHS